MSAKTETPRVEMVTVPLTFSLPNGELATGYAVVTPDVSKKTLAALRSLMEAEVVAALDKK